MNFAPPNSFPGYATDIPKFFVSWHILSDVLALQQTRAATFSSLQMVPLGLKTWTSQRHHLVRGVRGHVLTFQVTNWANFLLPFIQSTLCSSLIIVVVAELANVRNLACCILTQRLRVQARSLPFTFQFVNIASLVGVLSSNACAHKMSFGFWIKTMS